jgi:hypothetical protein
MRRRFLTIIILAAAVPLFATEPNPSLRQRELVEKLLEVTNVNQASLAMMDAVFVQIEKQFVASAEARGNRPADIAESKELFSEFRQRSSKIDLAGIMQEAYIRIYAKYFTEEELEALIAFYSTPAGKKSIEVMPDLAREGMEAGARELSPKIVQIMSEATHEQEKKRPWRRTMSDIRSLSTALEAYALDHDEVYPTGDYASLKSALAPDYLTEFPDKDIWGHPYAYVASADRKHYRLVSAGADSIFDWDSRRIAPETEPAATRYRDRLEDDIIYADSTFVQLPAQAKPDEELTAAVGGSSATSQPAIFSPLSDRK